MLKERKSYTYYPHFLHEDTNGERWINLLQAIKLVLEPNLTSGNLTIILHSTLQSLWSFWDELMTIWKVSSALQDELIKDALTD